jgi:pimeloyl-ACP methyl ester carboxylesterase
MPTIAIDNSELCYIEHGTGHIPIIFVHGLLLSSNMWRGYYFNSLPEKYHAYAPDMRGHGKAAHLDGCTIRTMAEDVFRFAQRLNIDKFVYVGVSMGGGVGIQLALNHPEMLHALVLLSPVTGFGPSGAFMFRLLGHFVARKRWLMRIMLKRMCIRTPPGNTLESVLDDTMLVRPSVLKEFVDDKEPISGIDRLKTLQVPTCVVFGDKDTAVPVEQQNRLADTIPNARKIVYPGEGHLVVAERQEDVRRDVLAFLTDTVEPLRS